MIFFSIYLSRSYGGRSGTPESTISIASYAQSMTGKTREERAKWNINDALYKEMALKNSSDGPGWLDRTMRDYEEESVSSSSYIRGQNAPVDPSILAEREIKRKKALELQTAIKQQLEERERLKKYERERQIMEERMEEQRLFKQLEEEQQRLEIEQQMQRMRLENERKKEELMRKAIEKAEFEAKLEKERRKGRLVTTSANEFIEINSINNNKEQIAPNNSNHKERQSSSASVKSLDDQRKSQETDIDGEKVLIGTPIKLKKKHLKYNNRKANSNFGETTEESEEDTASVNIPRKPIGKDATDVDGISLQVQSLFPVVPMQFGSNIFGMTPASNFGNVQLLMFAQPNQIMQQSNPFAMYPNVGIANVTAFSPQPSEISNAVEAKKEMSPTSTKLDDSRPQTASTLENHDMNHNDRESLCKLCDKYHVCASSQKLKQKEEDEDTDQQSLPVLPHDGTFTKEKVSLNAKLDAATSTNDDFKPYENLIDYRLHTPNNLVRTIDSSIHKQTCEIGIQTEFDCEFCEHKINHFQNLRSGMSRSSMVTKNERQKYLLEHIRSEEETTTTTTTTTIVKKEKKIDTLKDRPQWGVRVPAVQYLKASERDPFYQRNRRRRHLRASKSLDHSMKMDESSSSETTPHTPSQQMLRKKSYLSSRNICTELLPIKTDGNGKVYFVREKSFVINHHSKKKRGLQGIMPNKMLNRRPSIEGQDDCYSEKNNDFDSFDHSRTSSVEYND